MRNKSFISINKTKENNNVAHNTQTHMYTF